MGLIRRGLKRARKAIIRTAKRKATKKNAKAVAKTAAKTTAVAGVSTGIAAGTAAATQSAYDSASAATPSLDDNSPKNRTGTTNYVPGQTTGISAPSTSTPVGGIGGNGYRRVKSLARDLTNHEVGKVLRTIAKKLNKRARQIRRRRRTR